MSRILQWISCLIGALLVISLSMRMTPGNLDIFYPVTGEEKEPEMLTVASYRECLQRVCIT